MGKTRTTETAEPVPAKASAPAPAPALDVLDFGTRLLAAHDLDPVYEVLWRAVCSGGLPPPALHRWLLAYWCFYHAGTASWCAEDEEPAYWDRMTMAAASPFYPRCRERRHFRGAAAANSVAWLEERGIDYLFDPLLSDDPLPVELVMEWVKTWKGFGPWIAFKVADMVERLALAPVEFTVGAALYDSPRKGAELLWEVTHGLGAAGLPEAGPWALEYIVTSLSGHTAPPRQERPIGVQEAETILCKWHSYMGGHYHIGEDVAGCQQGLRWAARMTTAQSLLAAGKRGGLW